MRRTQVVFLALAFGLLGSADGFGKNIAWVSFHGGSEDGSVPSAAAAGVGFTQAPDKGYTDFLIGAGHTINRVTAPDPALNTAIPPAVLAELNAADLVIIGRSNDSAAFQAAAEAMSWNTEITKPMILTSGFISRGGTGGGLRLGYTQGETTADITTPQALATSLPAHPLFAGVTLDGNNQTGTALEVLTVPINGNPLLQRGASANNNLPVVGGTILATIPASGSPANAPMIVEYPAGTLSSQGQAFSSKRMLFITGSREANGITTQSAGIMDLTPVGQQLFLNAVNYITTVIVPGDTDGDGVGGEYPDDFTPILNNFRKTNKVRAQGDLNGDTVVNFEDFRQWKTVHGGSGASLDGIDFGFLGAVPEPGSAMLFLAAMITLVGHREWHRPNRGR